MIKEFKLPPRWLLEAADQGLDSQPLPLKNMLDNSLYYPASGCDFMPIQYFSGQIFSFIYVDYRPHFYGEVMNFKEKMHPSVLFPGEVRTSRIKLLGSREVKREEIISSSWKPQEHEGRPIVPRPERFSNNNKHGKEKSKNAIWCIFELDMPYMQDNVEKENERPHHLYEDRRMREDGFFHDHIEEKVEKLRYSDHIPKKTIVSLLYIFGEGVYNYDALYSHHKTHPAILALIQCFGFSSNWTNFADENDVFGRLVMNNPYGMPEYLMYGGWGNHTKEAPGHYGDPLWKNYSEYVDAIEGGDYTGVQKYAGIWRNINN